MVRSSESTKGACSLALSLTKVGDAWSMLILRDIAGGLTRFDQIRVNLSIAPNILTRRLRALTEAGVLEKHLYCERPPREEYRLTDAGREFLPVLYVIAEWGRRHNDGTKVSRLVDMRTGRPVEPLVVDAATGVPVAGLQLKMTTPLPRGNESRGSTG